MSQTVLQNQTTPATPVTGATSIFIDSADKHIKTKDDAGLVIDLTTTGGFPDPMTTIGDVIYRDDTNTTNRLPIGTNYQKLICDNYNGPQQLSRGGYKTTPVFINNAMSPYSLLPFTSDETIIADSSAGPVAVSLASLSFAADLGRVYTIKRQGANTVSIGYAGIATNIDNFAIGLAPTIELLLDHSSVTIVAGKQSMGGAIDFFITSYYGNSLTYIGTLIQIT